MARVVLDTNVLASALGRGGIPGAVFKLAIIKQITAVTSLFLLAELSEVLAKKFDFASDKINLIEKKLKKKFILVNPRRVVEVLPDNNPDNRVLEAALEGNCDYIVTGDKQLLQLVSWEGIRILTGRDFYEQYLGRNS
ncbi:MAG: putative toxin-antitoxin system toxin component, PIN family [Candidatus Doudnabacteria bacterium]|nr:putative toxin-antitoxin system toxin component, PIN family [Candidatus Doudnabacteria bacterium]